MYSSRSFLTSALDGGEWSASRPGRALPPGKGPTVPNVQEAGWVPEPVWTQGLEEKSSAPVGDRTPIVEPAVRHHTDRRNLWKPRVSVENCMTLQTELTCAEQPSSVLFEFWSGQFKVRYSIGARSAGWGGGGKRGRRDVFRPCQMRLTRFIVQKLNASQRNTKNFCGTRGFVAVLKKAIH
jgi:hypothetical protein